MSYKGYNSAYGQYSRTPDVRQSNSRKDRPSDNHNWPSDPSSSSMGFSGNSSDFESDKNQRCDVHLHQSPINKTSVHHWGTDFDCRDIQTGTEFKASCEGNEVEGKLKGNCRVRLVERDPSWRTEIGTIEISPQEILHAGQQNVYNNTEYRLATQNCQDWTNYMVEDQMGLHNPVPEEGPSGFMGSVIDEAYSLVRGAAGSSRSSGAYSKWQ